MAQTKRGSITLTDLNDGSSGDTYIEYTAYQNYIPATAISLPIEKDLDADGVLENTDLGNSWTVTSSTPTGSSVTFFTTRIFKQTAGTGDFVGQGTWPDAAQLTGGTGRPGDPGVAHTGRYSDLQTDGIFEADEHARWKILTDNGLIPNATDGVAQWTTSVNVLFLSDTDENGESISEYYETLRADDLGRLQTDATATPDDANIPDFCDIGSVESAPFICDSPAGYVVFKLLSTPVRMTPAGVGSDEGIVWRMSIETIRADSTPTLNFATSAVANFGWNKLIQGEVGGLGARGASRYDRLFTVTDAVAPLVGTPKFNQAARCAVAGGYPFNASADVVTCNSTAANDGSIVSLVAPTEGDVVILTVTESDGGLETRGAIHNGEGVANNDWKTFETQVDGHLLVNGTVVADALAVDSVTADKIKAGAITASKISLSPHDVGVGSDGSAADRMVITGDKIEIWENNVLRVVLGEL